jgi:hypothetical protein
MRNLLGVLLLLSASLAQAEIIVNAGPWNGGVPRNGAIIWVDTANGSYTHITNCVCAGITYDRANNRLFAIEYHNAKFFEPHDIFEIDIETGNKTVIGTIQIPAYNGIKSLAYDADNNIFYVANWWGDFLWRYNPVTGVTSKGPRTNERYVESLSFNSDNGLLYAARRSSVNNPLPGSPDTYILDNGIISIDPANGAVVSLPISAEMSAWSIQWDSVVGGTGYAYAFSEIAINPATNELYVDWPHLRAFNLDTFAERAVGFDAKGINDGGIELFPATAVAVDIDPWSDANEIKTLPQTLLPVAVLSTSIADGDSADFDATQIEPASVQFGPDAAPNVAATFITDIDGDADDDVIFGFRPLDAGITCQQSGPEEYEIWLDHDGAVVEDAMIAGATYAGERFGGSDFIVPKVADASQFCETESCHP